MLAVAVQMLPTGFRRVSDGGTSKGPDLRAPVSVSDGFRRVSDRFPTGFRRVSGGFPMAGWFPTGFRRVSRRVPDQVPSGLLMGAMGFWLSTGF